MGCDNSKEKEKKEEVTKAPPPPPPKKEVPREVEKPKAVTPKEPPRPQPNSAQLRALKVKDNFSTTVGRCIAEGRCIPCFPPEGLVYRIENGDAIHYYNDTVIFEAHVKYLYGPGSTITPGPQTVVTEAEDGWTQATCVVYPLETVLFATGKFNGVKVSVTLEPLSEQYLTGVDEQNEKVKGEKSKVEQVAGGETDPELVLKKCVDSNTLFVDLDFPPQQSSLSRRGIDARELPPIAFMRPTQYLRDDLKDQSDDIIQAVAPQTILRGNLGDCWVSCAAAVMARSEELVKQLFAFGNPSEKKVGAYRILIQKNGWMQKLILDNFLPVVNRSPAFASIVDDPRELWMSLLEKALAKVNGSYFAITGGDALDVIQDFTGAPIYRFDDEWQAAAKDSSLASEFASVLTRNASNIVVLSTPSLKSDSYLGKKQAADREATQKKYEKLGLYHGFTYLVDRMEMVKGTLLLHVVNPWNTDRTWDGPWGNNSPEWKSNIDAKIQCKPSWNNPGEFWMAWNDAINYFDGGGIIFNTNTTHKYSAKGMFHNLHPTAVLQLQASEASEVVLTLTQRDKRGIAIHEPDSIQGAIMLSVSAEEGEGEQVVVQNSTENPMAPSDNGEYKFTAGRSVSMKYTFEAGKKYFVIPRLHSGAVEPEHQREYVVSISSEKSLSGKLSAEVTSIPTDNVVFKNIVRFPTTDITNVEAELQITEHFEPSTRVSSILIA